MQGRLLRAFSVLACLFVMAGCSCIVQPDRDLLGPDGGGDAGEDSGSDADVGEDVGDDVGDDAEPDGGCEGTMESCNGRDDDCDERVDEDPETVCGVCDGNCEVPRGRAECRAGVCALDCDSGFLDCNGDLEDGCETSASTEQCGCGVTCAAGQVCNTAAASPECSDACSEGTEECGGSCVDLGTNPSHCGECGQVCEAGPGAETACVGAECTIGRCLPGFADCDGDPSNGCEVETDTDIANCGACELACDAPMATLRCEAGECVVESCEGSVADCNMDPSDGCETILGTSRDCGSCGDVCTRPGSVATCDVGVCIFECEPGRLDCDGDPDNGCEVDGQADPSNCGTCGRACELGVCEMGSCGGDCPPGRADCDAEPSDCETDLTSDTNNCGGCNVVCSEVGGTATCASRTCVIECDAGSADCNRSATDGCETPLGTISDCMACDDSCTFPNATGVCTAAGCEIGTCAPGFSDCDGDRSNGCETSTASDDANCGMCGFACSLPNGLTTCTLGECQLIGCAANFDDCDGEDTTGCEADLLRSDDHCGMCDSACTPPPGGGLAECSGGTCNVSCPSPLQLCADGCVDVATSDANCGTCDNACPSGETCVDRACVPEVVPEICNRRDDNLNLLTDENLLTMDTPRNIQGSSRVRGDQSLVDARYAVVSRGGGLNPPRYLDIFTPGSGFTSGPNPGSGVRSMDVCAGATGFFVVRTDGDDVQWRVFGYGNNWLGGWNTISRPSGSWDTPDYVRCDGLSRGAAARVAIVWRDERGSDQTLYGAWADDAGAGSVFSTPSELRQRDRILEVELTSTSNGFAIVAGERNSASDKSMWMHTVPAAAFTSPSSPTPIPMPRSIQLDSGGFATTFTGAEITYSAPADRVIVAWWRGGTDWRWTDVDPLGMTKGSTETARGWTRIASANEGDTRDTATFALLQTFGFPSNFEIRRIRVISHAVYPGSDHLTIPDSGETAFVGANGPNSPPNAGTRYLLAHPDNTRHVRCE